LPADARHRVGKGTAAIRNAALANGWIEKAGFGVIGTPGRIRTCDLLLQGSKNDNGSKR
jgi:hypothetical protein